MNLISKADFTSSSYDGFFLSASYACEWPSYVFFFSFRKACPYVLNVLT